MARIGVQYEAVVEAALQLQKQGDNPTIQRLREYLGTGSFTTISEHLRLWRENQRNATPLQQEAQDLPTSLIKMAQELWQQACNEADEKLQIYQQQAAAEIRQALTDKQVALEEAQRMEEKNGLLDKKNNELLTDMKQQAALLSRLETQLETSNQQLTSLTTASQIKEAAASQQISELKQKLDKQQQEHQLQIQQQQEQQQLALAHEQQRNEENQLRWMQEVDLARQQTASLKEAAQQEAQQAKLTLKQLEEKLIASQTQLQQQALTLQAEQLQVTNLLEQQQLLKAAELLVRERLGDLETQLVEKQNQLQDKQTQLVEKQALLQEKQTTWAAKLELAGLALADKDKEVAALKATLVKTGKD